MALKSNFGDLLEPGLREIYDTRYNEIPQIFPQLLTVNTSTHQSEKDSAISGFGYFDETTEGGSVTYEDPVQMFDVTYTHKKYTKGFKVSEEMYDDDMYRIINRKPGQLAIAAKRTAEYHAAGLFNNAFSTTQLGGDGKPLCSIYHTRSDGGSDQMNKAAQDLALSDANLNTAILAFEGQLDDKGMKIATEANILLVPRALKKTATVITQSSGLVQSDYNDMNYSKTLGLKVVAWHYLTSTTAWFLIDSSVALLNWFWRKQPEFKQDNSFDTGMALFKTSMRFSKGFSDWRGVWGSKGDNSTPGV
jgi:phage major head subunit gpT-like protein